MCFRPTEMSMNECPECGASNKPIATVCEQCGAELNKVDIDFDADQAKLDASATAMPGGPAPSAPDAAKPLGASKDPDKPKPPGAPPAPGAPKPPPGA